jgi:hypothetical protein
VPSSVARSPIAGFHIILSCLCSLNAFFLSSDINWKYSLGPTTNHTKVLLLIIPVKVKIAFKILCHKAGEKRKHFWATSSSWYQG